MWADAFGACMLVRQFCFRPRCHPTPERVSEFTGWMISTMARMLAHQGVRIRFAQPQVISPERRTGASMKVLVHDVTV